MSIVMLNPTRAKGLTVFLGAHNEADLTLMEMLKDPERYSPEWKEVYYLLTGERLETKTEKKFGAMIDKYMDGKI